MVKGNKDLASKFERAGDMEDIQRARSEVTAMLPAKISRAPQNRPPRYFGQQVAALLEVVIQGGERRFAGTLVDQSAVGRQRDPIGKLDSAVVGDRQRSLDGTTPGGYGARLWLMPVKF